MARAKLVLTDSPGIQEETTALQVPCLTLRMNTERPSTVELGINERLAMIWTLRNDWCIGSRKGSGRKASYPRSRMVTQPCAS